MLYVSSSCVKKEKIAEIVRDLAESGIRNIELSGGTVYYSGIEHDLAALKSQYQLQYVCHSYFPPPKIPFVVNLASCNDRIYKQSMEHYENCINMMHRIGCDVLSIHAGFLIEILAEELGNRLHAAVVYDEEQAYDRFCHAYEHIKKRCGQNGMNLFLENNVLNAENYREFHGCNYLMMTDYHSIMKMKDQMEFNLLLDLAHLHVSTNTLGLDYAEECEKLGGYAKWIHISENSGVFDEHKPLQKDSIILSEFQKIYTPWMNATLETVGDIEEILDSVAITEEIISGKEGKI